MSFNNIFNYNLTNIIIDLNSIIKEDLDVRIVKKLIFDNKHEN